MTFVSSARAMVHSYGNEELSSYYRIVRIISPWAISHASARIGWAYNISGLFTNIPYRGYIRVLYLYKNLELKRGGWAYNTSWAYNTYYTVLYFSARVCTTFGYYKRNTRPDEANVAMTSQLFSGGVGIGSSCRQLFWYLPKHSMAVLRSIARYS